MTTEIFSSFTQNDSFRKCHIVATFQFDQIENKLWENYDVVHREILQRTTISFPL